MKTLELNQMEIVEGGTYPPDAETICAIGIGIAIATGGWGILIGVALCLSGDS